jgi:hypothetical protein
MRGRVTSYLARHHWGIFATFVALGGTAYASGSLPLAPNSVGTKQIKANAVSLSKVGPRARFALEHPQMPKETAAGYTVVQVVGTRFGWEEYGPPFPGASYYRDNEGVVHLAGVVKSFGGGSDPNVTPNQCASSSEAPAVTPPPIFVLPASDRPADRHDFAVDSNGSLGVVDVLPSGQVVCESGSGDRSVSLDGITFRAGG